MLKIPVHQSSESVLADQLYWCFGFAKYSDLTFMVGEKAFYSHKFILSARSPVFSAMFGSDMQENWVEITDAKPEVFCEMLRYIYSGKIFNIKEFATELIVLADKYELEHLKILCGNAILDNIEIETAGDMLILADVYSPIELKPLVLKYIASHFTTFSETDKYSDMKESHPNLLLSVYETLVKLVKLSNANLKL